jgi:hypothetical protein
MVIKELRIGNLVWYECETMHMTTVAEIISINNRGTHYTVDLRNESGNIIKDEGLHDLEPIPLDEKWLSERYEIFQENKWALHGFWRTGTMGNVALLELMYFPSPEPMFCLNISRSGDSERGRYVNNIKEVKFVHDLQNTCFQISNEELNIKLLNATQ